MDVNGVQGNIPGMDAANAQKTAQAQGQEENVKAAAADNAQQEASKPQVPGVGETINITV